MTSDDTAAPLKIVLLGDSGTGKTNLLARLTGNKFKKQWVPTSGLNMATHHPPVGNDMVKIEFWDFAGQEKYRTMANGALNDADGILLVYDISNYATFENLNEWLKDITKWAESKTVVKLVGNKSDLKQQRAVTMEEVSQWATEHGLLYVETSALEDSNMRVTLESMIQEILATMNSVSENTDDAGIFSTCSFITSRMMKEASNDTQPFHVVLVDVKRASGRYAPPTIKCVKKPLDDPDLKYVALSYRWGELSEVAIDTKVGYTAMIKSFSLDTFYQLCRSMVKEVDLKDINYVWIDAICVDQANYERRKATIYHMSAIYERAEYILAVPDLHYEYLQKTSTLHSYTIRSSHLFREDLYFLIHGKTDRLAQVEDERLNEYGVRNDSALRQSLKRDTDHFMDGLMTYREHHDRYNAENILDHIADHHHHHEAAATTTSNEEDNPRDWRRDDDDDGSFPTERLQHCHQIDCPLDLSHRELPFWREKLIYENGQYDDQTWKQLIIARSTQLRRSMDFMADLIKDWSSRVWVISEYNIAKKKNNMKYWFVHLGKFNFLNLSFFPFDFTDTSLAATIDSIPYPYVDNSSDPAYINFHRIMISQLKQQTFFEMMLKSKASRNEDRFYAIFPIIPEYKSTISSKTVVSGWKIDTLVSVKLKLYEVMNTKDKLNLLFSSSNEKAALLAEALPTFATTDINWDIPAEHITLDGKDTNHGHYNFDMTSPSTLTLHYHPLSDQSPNLSDQPYLNLKPKEFYVVKDIGDSWRYHNYAGWDFPGAQHLSHLLQPHEPTLTVVTIPSWIPTAMKGYYQHHVNYLAGDKDRNIWILVSVYRFFAYPEFDRWTRCTAADYCSGFNIY